MSVAYASTRNLRAWPLVFAAALIVCLGSKAAGYEPARDLASAGELPAGNSESGLARKWQAVEAAVAADRSAMARCRAAPGDCPSPAALRINAIVDAARLREGRGRIGEINRAINLAIKAAADSTQFGIPDVWSSPLVTFAAGAGDCEDYAIAKYAALQEAGFPADDLRLLIVRNEVVRQDHAVLAVRYDGRWLILDNQRMAMIEARHFNRKPLFVLGRDGAASAKPAFALFGAQASWSGSGVPLLM